MVHYNPDVDMKMKSFGATFFYDRMPFLASTTCVGCSIKTVLNLTFQTKIN